VRICSRARRPRNAWAICAVAAAAAHQTGSRRLAAQAEFYLSRAANDWTRPARVEAAVQRTRELFLAVDEPVWAAACD